MDPQHAYPIPVPSEEEVLAQYTLRLERWEYGWKRCRLTTSLEVTIRVCGQRPLHPDRTIAEEAAIWQHFADENGGDDAALGELGPKPTAEGYPDAAEHDARAYARRAAFMRQETTRNSTPKLRDIPPGTVRDDLTVRLSGPEPKPLPERMTFAGYAPTPPEAARMAPTPSVEPIAPPVYEAFDLGDDDPALPSADELDAMSDALDGGAPAPTPRIPIMQSVPRADTEDSFVGLQRAALALEALDATPDPNDGVLDIKIAEQAIEYPVPDPPVAPRTPLIEAPHPIDEDVSPPETSYRTRSHSGRELRLLLSIAVVGLAMFLTAQLFRRESTHLPDVPAVCLLPQALDQLPSAEQMRYVDCQLPHEARPSFHCRAPSPNSEAAQVDLCTRAWRACAPPFGTAISPEAQAHCLARIVPPSSPRP
jgi:hypothetical protein